MLVVSVKTIGRQFYKLHIISSFPLKNILFSEGDFEFSHIAEDCQDFQIILLSNLKINTASAGVKDILLKSRKLFYNSYFSSKNSFLNKHLWTICPANRSQSFLPHLWPYFDLDHLIANRWKLANGFSSKCYCYFFFEIFRWNLPLNFDIRAINLVFKLPGAWK